jgi:hypothetical protein
VKRAAHKGLKEMSPKGRPKPMKTSTKASMKNMSPSGKSSGYPLKGKSVNSK